MDNRAPTREPLDIGSPWKDPHFVKISCPGLSTKKIKFIDLTKPNTRHARLLGQLLKHYPHTNTFHRGKIYSISIRNKHHQKVETATNVKHLKIRLGQTIRRPVIHSLNPTKNTFSKQENELLTRLQQTYLDAEHDILSKKSVYYLTKQDPNDPTRSIIELTQLSHSLYRYKKNKLAVEGLPVEVQGTLSSVKFILGRLIQDKSASPLNPSYLFASKKQPYLVKHVRGDQVDASCRMLSATEHMNKEAGFTGQFNIFNVKGPSHDRANNESAFLMRKLPGCDLFELIVKNQTAPLFTTDQLLKLCHLLFKELENVHKNGITHRDIKPENIRVELDEHNNPIGVIYYDFGLAKKSGILARESCGGTLRYIAPELFTQSSSTPESDAFSLGRVLWYLFGSFYLTTFSEEDFMNGITPCDLKKIPGLFNPHFCRDDNLSAQHKQFIERLLLKLNCSDPNDRFGVSDGFYVFARIIRERAATLSPPTVGSNGMKPR